MIDDEDDEDEILDGTEGEGTEGADDAGGDEEASLSAEHPESASDEGAAEKGGEVAEGEKPQRTRGQNRFQTLSNENKQLKERLDRQERERQEERRQQWQQNQARTEAEERERLALMTPDERADYRISQMERRTNETLRQSQLQTNIHLDRNAYEAKAAVNPVYARYRDEVEAKFQEHLARGAPVEREVILKYLLGEKALNGAGKSRDAARRGRARVERERVPPAGGKGDASSQRGRVGSTAEERLKDVLI